MNCVCKLVTSSFTYDTRVQKEAKTLAQDAGYDVTVFALQKDNSPQEEYRDGYRVERIRVRSRTWGKNLPAWAVKYLEFCARAIRHVTRLDPAVVHTHDIDALIPGYIAARLSRSKLVYDAHELWAERQHNIIRYPWLRRLIVAFEGLLSRRADAVITVNPSLANHLAEQHNIPTPTVLMHCQEYRPVERNDILRREFNIPPDQHIVIYAGLMKPGRGLDMLIRAAPYLDRAVIILMGPEQIRSHLEHLTRELKVQNRVLFRDPVPPEDVQYYVASADIGVMPTQNVDLSYYYGAGNKLFHYLAAGIPAAVSNHPEKRRIVETYGVGAVFDENDPQDIARTINQLLSNEKIYQAMCRRAREATQERLNWRVESRKLLSLYTHLLKKNSVI
jgi:glycosyltransferase involved in cell wall biosynthesis